MKLSILAGYSPATMQIDMDKILLAESLGYDCVWTAEAYGSDAVSPAAWILALTSTIKAGTAKARESGEFRALTLGKAIRAAEELGTTGSPHVFPHLIEAAQTLRDAREAYAQFVDLKPCPPVRYDLTFPPAPPTDEEKTLDALFDLSRMVETSCKAIDGRHPQSTQ